MKKISLLMACVVGTILLAASTGRADDHPGKKLLTQWGQQFVGSWERENELDQDLPGLGKKGDTVHSFVTWTDRNGVFSGEFIGRVNGKVMDSATAVVGWDPALKGISVQWFSRNGAHASNLFKKNGDAWVGTFRLSSPDGSKSQHDARITFNGAELIDHQTNRQSDGKPLPERTLTSIKTSGSSPEEAILRIEREWSDAMVDGDGDWFKKALADDFRIVLPDAEVWDRDKFADAWTTGTIDCSKSDILDLDVRIIGDLAIVIGHGDIAGKSNGKEFAHTEKWTSVYRKVDGEWKCVNCHTCKVGE